MKQICILTPPKASKFLILTLCLLLSSCTHQQNQKTRIRSEKITPKPEAAKPWSSKKISELSIDEAWAAYDYYKSHSRLPHLGATLERLILLTPDQSQLEPLLTELSDIKIELGLLEEAETLLEEYCTLYPGNTKTPQRRLKLIDVQLRQNSSPERDLNKAEKALESAQKLQKEQTASTTDQLSESEQEALATAILIAQKLIVTKALNKVLFYTNRYRYTQKNSALIAALKNLEKSIENLITEPMPPFETLQEQSTLKQHLTIIKKAIEAVTTKPEQALQTAESVVTQIKQLAKI